MKCPLDGADLVMADRNGIEIDYCPKCRGVWLDRGELDKIIERSAAVAPASRGPRLDDTPVVHPEPGRAAEAYAPRPERPREDDRHRGEYRPEYRDDDRGRYRDDDDRRYGKPYRKRREGFLADLFDFD
jgi:Zn-finger nucleic acid-binding protein